LSGNSPDGLRKLEYASPPTTQSDTARRRSGVLMLLGYLPTVLLVAMVIWYFISLASAFHLMP
jgi:hypothetical protein